MKTKVLTSVFLVAVVFAFGIAFATPRFSTDQTQQAQASQGQTNPGMMGGGMMGGQGQGMMAGGVTGMMGQMSTHHQQMTTLMSKLMKNMTAIQNEKDPEALKSKLAEHQALLNQMQSQMTKQGSMMQMMSGQIKQSCPGAGENAAPPAK